MRKEVINKLHMTKGESYMRRILFVLPVVVCLLMLYAGSAHAVGTASGTLIDNFATMTATNVPSATTSNTVNNTVTAVYGATTTVDPVDGNTGVGSFIDYGFEVQNPGNDTQAIGINAGVQGFSAGAGTTTDWSVAVDDASPFGAGLNWQNSGGATAAQAGDQATMAAPIGPDALASYTVRVTVAGDAVDSATGDLVVKFVSAQTPLGPYVGYNGNDYGEAAEAFRAAGTGQGVTYLTTTVQGPVLTLSKAVASIDSNLAGYTGGANDPVPGARITYRIEFSNTGTVDATSVEMSDVLPVNTAYFVNSIQSCFTGPLCAVGVDASGDANDAADDCWYDAGPPVRVGCDVANMAAAGGGGAVEYEVTID